MDFTTFSSAAHPAIQKYAAQINEQAKAAGIPPCALAAVVLRESSGVADAHSFDGGWGLCQITAGVNPQGVHIASGMSMLDPDSNLYVAAQYFLKGSLKHMLDLRDQYADEMKQPILFYVFGSFNAGDGAMEKAIENGYDPDAYTTNNYCSGTLAFYNAFVKESHAVQGNQ